MRLGLELPQSSAISTRENIAIFAREAEQLGYDSLWVSDRLLYPTEPRQLMGGQPWSENTKRVLDPLDTLSFVAALTETVWLGTSVLDLPFYTPARLAKRIATLDVLSNGRVTVAGGVGWSEDEAIASNISLSERGARTEEMLQALTELWGPDPVEHHGKFYQVPKTLFNPKPIQQPRPRLVMGGFSPAALDRAARLSDGFNVIASTNIADVDQFIGLVQAAWRKVEREGEPEIVMRVNHSYISEVPLGPDRSFLTGSEAQVREDVQKLAAMGVTEVFFSHVANYGDSPDGFEQILRQAYLTRNVA